MKEQPLPNSCDHHVFQAGCERSDVTVFPELRVWILWCVLV